MKMRETDLKLSKNQIQNVINDYISQEKGLNDLFEMLINGLMYSERECFLKEKPIEGNKSNGFRTVQKAGIGSKLSLQIPRDRMGVFQPVIYGLINQQETQIKDLCFELYGKGLTTRQIEDVIEKIYGSSYSKSSISRITTDFGEYVDSWLSRGLDSFYPIIYIDAIHIKVRRDTVQTEAFYVLLGLKEDYTREVLGIINIPQESATGWEEVLLDIKERGVQKVGMFVFDDLTGLSNVIGKQFADALQQKCTLHFQRNILKHVRKTDREEFSNQMKEVFNPDDVLNTPKNATTNLKLLLTRWKKKYPGFSRIIERDDLETVFTYFEFDYRIRRMVYTTNWIERLNKSFRRTLKMRNALPNPTSAITLMAFVAMEMEEGTYSYPITSFKFDENFVYN